MPPAGTFFGARCQEDLDLRVRKNNGAHIPAVCDQSGRLPERSLTPDEGIPDCRDRCDSGGGVACSLGPQFQRHIAAREQYASIVLGGHELDRQGLRQPRDRRPILRINALCLGMDRDGPVECAAVQQMPPEAFCGQSADRSLAGPSGSIDGYNRNRIAVIFQGPRSSHILKPTPAAAAANPGKDVAALAVSPIVIGEREIRPATAIAMAIL